MVLVMVSLPLDGDLANGLFCRSVGASASTRFGTVGTINANHVKVKVEVPTVVEREGCSR